MRNPYDTIGRIGLLLAILGAVNWLLVGLFEWNAAQWIFTQSGTQPVDSLGERIVYIAVGVGGILAVPMLAATLARSRRRTGYDEASATGGRDRDDLRADDMAYYSGAPKHAPAGSRPAVTGVRSGRDEPSTARGDRDLRYGPVEEADDEYGEEYRRDERRAA